MTPPVALTPMPQDANYSINPMDILRPKNTIGAKKLCLGGEFYLDKYTKTWICDDKKTEGTETIQLLDIVKPVVPVDHHYQVVSITGAPFDDVKRRCTPTSLSI